MDQDSSKLEDISQYVKNLELENKNENLKLIKLNNDLKKEEAKKIEFELKIEELKQNIDFYTSQAMNFSKRLNYGKKMYSQFELATECSKRFISLYNSPSSDYSMERRDVFNFDISDFSNEIEQLYRKIQENVTIINDLLNDLMDYKET
ncbi:uncharacterized protein LOC130896635 [Diorhabda carinulata]|uniref:uncharacterized protein LOC130896635 n=1 Tax=Diorhabda carinulata TaxID=1163345 RepID=UPI0025A06911|nr:uncharacterized protein LOC130896635 [Diorhabda carinulata]